MLKPFSFLVVFALLSSCQVQQQEPEAASWTLAGWTLKGRLALTAPQESGTYSIYWQQFPGAFDLRLSGTLGIPLARVTGQAGQACIEVPGQEDRCALDAATLIYQSTSLVFPVEALLHWVRGQPVPGKPVQRTGRESFLQLGWRVEYTGRDATSGLPRKITLTRPDIRLRLVVSEWQ